LFHDSPPLLSLVSAFFVSDAQIELQIIPRLKVLKASGEETMPSLEEVYAAHIDMVVRLSPEALSTALVDSSAFEKKSVAAVVFVEGVHILLHVHEVSKIKYHSFLSCSLSSNGDIQSAHVLDVRSWDKLPPRILRPFSCNLGPLTVRFFNDKVHLQATCFFEQKPATDSSVLLQLQEFYNKFPDVASLTSGQSSTGMVINISDDRHSLRLSSDECQRQGKEVFIRVKSFLPNSLQRFSLMSFSLGEACGTQLELFRRQGWLTSQGFSAQQCCLLASVSARN
jgi:hypothetical protein